MRVFFVQNSENRKTGNIPQAYTHHSTCPAACMLKGAGCYAESGPVRLHWDKTLEEAKSISWEEFIEKVRGIEAGRLWRYAVAGDLPGEGDVVNHKMLVELVEANRGRKGFTYTHKPLNYGNAFSIGYANRRGLTINLSADTLQEADEKAATLAGPVVVTIPSDPSLWPKRTPEGRKVVVCPAETHAKTCLECRMCANPRRKTVIGFPAHGTGKRKLDERLARK